MFKGNWFKKILSAINPRQGKSAIDDAQATHIQYKYKDKLEYGRLINTVITLGSILVGLGILLFVASNWDKIARPHKIFIIFTIISFFNIAGYYFRYIKDETPGLGEGFLFIGTFAYGAGIWLIAQIYQIHYNYSAGILFWVIGILPLAFIHRSWMISTLSSFLSCLWLCSYYEYYPLRQGYGFFILAVLLVLLAYTHKQRFSLFMIIAGIVIWLSRLWFLSYAWPRYGHEFLVSSQVALVTIFQVLGIILFALGIWHKRLKKVFFVFLYQFLGVFLISFSTYSLTFSHHYDQKVLLALPLKCFLLIIFLFFVATTLLHKLYFSSKDKAQTLESRLITWTLSLAGICFCFSFAFFGQISLVFNILLVLQIFLFIYLGFISKSEGIFRFAIFLFFVHILSRYFDIFWKMMPRSLLFIGGGLLLIIGSIIANKKTKELKFKAKPN